MVNRTESQLIFDRIIFADRNRSYGAFDLRKEYNARLRTAIILSFFIFTTTLFLTNILNLSGKEIVDDDTKVSGPIVFEEIILPHAKVKLPIPASKVEVPKVESKKFLEPVIKDNDLVTVETPTPTSDDLEKANPGSEDSNGDKDIALAPSVGDANNVAGNEINEKKVEGWASVDAKFESGELSKYIQKNLRFPSKAVDHGVDGKVFVQFIIEKDGTVTDVKVIRGIGFGCDEEAVRVVQLTSGMWQAGNNNGTPVRLRKIIPITFRLLE